MYCASRFRDYNNPMTTTNNDCIHCNSSSLESDADGNLLEHYFPGSVHLICRGEQGVTVEYRLPDRTRIAFRRRDIYEALAAPPVLDFQRAGRMVLITRADLG